MEIAIPFIALAGAYIISNQETIELQNSDSYQKKRLLHALNKEEFTNMGKKVNSLPNQDIPPQNYPITNVAELVDTVREYPNPNTAIPVVRYLVH